MTNTMNSMQNNPLSLFDIENTLYPLNPSERWKAYQSFMINLKKDLEEKELENIENFWHNYNANESSNDNKMTWINSIAVINAKKAMENDKDKQHSKCFNNLIFKKKPLYPESFDIFDSLDNELPNFTEITQFYRGSFALNQSRDIAQFQSPRPVLLLGNPGIGKTHYAKKIAQLLNTSYRFFDADSISGSWVLTGHNSGWRGADAGLIFKEMARSETISPIILLDEIDKIHADREHSPFSVFHQLFEKENATSFYDEFVDIEFDASQIIYILTANDISNIAPSLLSRMNVFTVPNPDEVAMKKIIQKIYQAELGGSNLFNSVLPKDEVEKLVHLTPREAKQIISKNIFTYASKSVTDKNKAIQSITIENNQKIKRKIGF